MDFLSENGLLIFKELKKHCKVALKLMDIDDYELRMLANSFDKYSINARFCRDQGDTFEMATKTGVYPMIRPEYNVMKNEYSQILTHSGKFGLNPGDREKIFKKMKVEEAKPKGFETGMKVTKTA
jgi:phage terminase small subunit